MVRLEATFGCAERMSPDIAAKIVECASRYEATTALEQDGRSLVLGSLIGVLSMELKRGSAVKITAEGADATSAAEALRALLAGENG